MSSASTVAPRKRRRASSQRRRRRARDDRGRPAGDLQTRARAQSMPDAIQRNVVDLHVDGCRPPRLNRSLPVGSGGKPGLRGSVKRKRVVSPSTTSPCHRTAVGAEELRDDVEPEAEPFVASALVERKGSKRRWRTSSGIAPALLTSPRSRCPSLPSISSLHGRAGDAVAARRSRRRSPPRPCARWGRHRTRPARRRALRAPMLAPGWALAQFVDDRAAERRQIGRRPFPAAASRSGCARNRAAARSCATCA